MAYGMFAALVGLQLTLGIGAQLTNLTYGLYYTEIFLFLVPALGVSALLGFSPASVLSLRKVPWLWVALGLLLGCVNYPLAAVLEALVRALVRLVSEPLADSFDASVVFQSTGRIEQTLIVLAVGVMAPLGEEPAFRGFIQRALMSDHRPSVAIAITATLFSAIHFDPIGFPARLELGLLFGYIAYRTGSLWPSIAAHAGNNLLATGLYYVAGDSDDAASDPKLVALVALAALGLVLTAPLLIALKRITPQPEPITEPPQTLEHRPRALPWIGLWVVLSVAGLLIVHVIDPVGVKLNLTDVEKPVNHWRHLSSQPSGRELIERLQDLRRQVRSGSRPLTEYESVRDWMNERDRESEQKPLTQADADALLQRLRVLETTPAN
jgi:membrane protease YdiL (CAAX protease family)